MKTPQRRQAEIARSLESYGQDGDYDRQQEMVEAVPWLLARIAGLEAALQFYAAYERWGGIPLDRGQYSVGYAWIVAGESDDPGATARAALAAMPGEGE